MPAVCSPWLTSKPLVTLTSRYQAASTVWTHLWRRGGADSPLAARILAQKVFVIPTLAVADGLVPEPRVALLADPRIRDFLSIRIKQQLSRFASPTTGRLECHHRVEGRSDSSPSCTENRPSGGNGREHQRRRCSRRQPPPRTRTSDAGRALGDRSHQRCHDADRGHVQASGLRTHHGGS